MKLLLSLVIVLGLVGIGSALDLSDCGLNINYNLYDICPFLAKTYQVQGTSDVQNVTLSLAAPFIPACNSSDPLVWGQSYLSVGALTGATCADIATGDPTFDLLGKETTC